MWKVIDIIVLFTLFPAFSFQSINNNEHVLDHLSNPGNFKGGFFKNLLAHYLTKISEVR